MARRIISHVLENRYSLVAQIFASIIAGTISGVFVYFAGTIYTNMSIEAENERLQVQMRLNELESLCIEYNSRVSRISEPQYASIGYVRIALSDLTGMPSSTTEDRFMNLDLGYLLLQLEELSSPGKSRNAIIEKKRAWEELVRIKHDFTLNGSDAAYGSEHALRHTVIPQIALILEPCPHFLSLAIGDPIEKSE